jgi:putative resolvase
VNLTQWARVQGVHSQTACRWLRAGQMPVAVVRVSQRAVLVSPATAGRVRLGLGLFARVSSGDQLAGLGRQVARLSERAAATGIPVVRVGSGMSRRRSKIRRLLAGPAVTTVVIEHRGRLARMNTELVEAALAARGRHLAVPGPGELDDDLVRDMAEVLTSFCARLYGRRSARNRARRAVLCAQRNPDPAYQGATS